MAQSQLSPPRRRLRRDLRIIGSNLSEVMLLGSLLGERFAYVSLVHSLEPMIRAAADDAAMITVVLLDEAASSEQLLRLIQTDATQVLLCDLPETTDAAVEAAGGIVLPRASTAALEALVTSIVAQLSLSEVL